MRPLRWGRRSRRLTSMSRCINCHEAAATTVVLILYCKSPLNYPLFWRWNEEAHSIGDHNQSKSIPLHLCSNENERVSYDHERRITRKIFCTTFIIWPWKNKIKLTLESTHTIWFLLFLFFKRSLLKQGFFIEMNEACLLPTGKVAWILEICSSGEAWFSVRVPDCGIS